MAGRRTNLALLIAMPLAIGTGVAAFALGSGWNRWVTVAHGVLGLALLGLVPTKSTIARRGLRHRLGVGTGVSIALGVTVVVAVAAGVIHALGARDLGPVTFMQIHVGAAIATVPLLGWHGIARPVWPRRTDLSRRSLLGAGTLAAGGLAGWLAVEGAGQALGLAGADRRFTGSHERGSGEPSAMPITQWFNDTVPRISADEWQLTLRPAPDRVEVIDYETLAEPGERLATVLDCTGGWWSEQEWGGIRLDRLLAEATGNSLLVTSATGYQRRFPLGDADRLFLATEVGGEPLSAGHGFPARLVAPGRRGFWWVKWVTAIEASERPWWWQAPFPLS